MSKWYLKTCRRSVTTSGTREAFEPATAGQVAYPDFYRVKSITIRANAANTGNIYIGDSNRVSSTDYSYILAPGETLSLDVDKLGSDAWLDLTKWWIDADTNANALSFAAITDKAAW